MFAHCANNSGLTDFDLNRLIRGALWNAGKPGRSHPVNPPLSRRYLKSSCAASTSASPHILTACLILLDQGRFLLHWFLIVIDERLVLIDQRIDYRPSVSPEVVMDDGGAAHKNADEAA